MRTIKYWIRYRPRSREVLNRVYRNKAAARKASRPGEIIVKVQGFYIPRPELFGK